MDWATEASIQIVLALLFGLFIGWIIVETRKAIHRKEKKMDKRAEEKERDSAFQQLLKEDMEKFEKKKFLDGLYEAYKTRSNKPGESESRKKDDDEYHK